ncbi:MAG: hypothetical protein ABGY11_08830 [Candidatus Thioglobus sp.]
MFYKLFMLFSILLASSMLFSSEVYAQVLDDKANMKVLKVRAKLLRGGTTQKYSAGKLSNYQSIEEQIRAQVNCGSIDIGNQDVDSNFSGEINIIVVGDIVNAGNNCR